MMRVFLAYGKILLKRYPYVFLYKNGRRLRRMKKFLAIIIAVGLVLSCLPAITMTVPASAAAVS